MKQRQIFLLIFILSQSLFCPFAYAEKAKFNEEEQKLLKARKTYSIRIYPDVLTNLRLTNQQKKLKYVQIRLDLIAATERDMLNVYPHIPLIKDSILLLLNKQTTLNFKKKAKTNSVRDKLLIIINNLLYTELKKKPITEIIFQNVIIE